MKKTCFDYSMDYIYRFPKTEKELNIQLLKKWYSQNEIDKTIDILKQKGFVDDKLFCEMYINSTVVKKWKPIDLIKNKLFLKWIEKDILNNVIEDLNPEILYWMEEKIRKEIDKLKKKWNNGFDIIQKIAARWYSIHLIKKVIKNLTN